MSFLFLRNPNLTIENPEVTPPGGTAGDPLDISCHIVEVELSSDVETSEVPTYCNPSAQVTGPPVYAAAMTWNVTIETTGGATSNLADDLTPYIGKVCTFTLWETGATKGHEFRGLLSENPALKGSFVPGERVTSETDFGLAAAPTIVTITTP